MAHGIMENDWMFSAHNERPWHGLGDVIQDAPTSVDAIRIAHLDWQIKQVPVSANGIEIPGYFANMRSDTNEAVGVVRSRYNVVQNAEAFAFVDDIIQNTQGIECRYETAGSLFNGKKTFMLVRLPETNLVGDKAENYMFLMNSHDGSSGIMAGVSTVRVVCNNTLQYAIGEAGRAQRLWNIRHTKNLEGRKQEAADALKLAIDYQQQAAQIAWQMASKKIDEKRFFERLYDAWNRSEKGKEVGFTAIHEIYTNKDDLQNFRGTAWGMYNAVADYVSNRPNRENKERRLVQTFTGFDLLDVSEKIIAEIAA